MNQFTNTPRRGKHAPRMMIGARSFAALTSGMLFMATMFWPSTMRGQQILFDAYDAYNIGSKAWEIAGPTVSETGKDLKSGYNAIRPETKDDAAEASRIRGEWKAKREAREAQQRAEQKASDDFLDQAFKAVDEHIKAGDVSKVNLFVKDLIFQHMVTSSVEKRAEAILDKAGVSDDAIRKEIREAVNSGAQDVLEKVRDEVRSPSQEDVDYVVDALTVNKVMEDLSKRIENSSADRVDAKRPENVTPAPPAAPTKPAAPATPQSPAAPAETPEEAAARLRKAELLAIAEQAQAEALKAQKKRDDFVAAVAGETEKDPPKDPPNPPPPPETVPPPGTQSELSDADVELVIDLLTKGLEKKPGQELRPLEGLTQEELAELRRQARANRPAQASAGSKPTNHVAPSQATNEEYRRRAQGLVAARADKDRLEQSYLNAASQLEGAVRQREAWEAYQQSLAEYNRELAAWEAANPFCPKCGIRHPPDWEEK